MRTLVSMVFAGSRLKSTATAREKGFVQTAENTIVGDVEGKF